MTPEQMQDRIDALEDCLHQIHTWTISYPPTIFIEPSKDKWTEIHAALNAIGTSSEPIHGSWARHITAGVRQICEGVLK